MISLTKTNIDWFYKERTWFVLDTRTQFFVQWELKCTWSVTLSELLCVSDKKADSNDLLKVRKFLASSQLKFPSPWDWKGGSVIKTIFCSVETFYNSCIICYWNISLQQAYRTWYIFGIVNVKVCNNIKYLYKICSYWSTF